MVIEIWIALTRNKASALCDIPFGEEAVRKIWNFHGGGECRAAVMADYQRNGGNT